MNRSPAAKVVPTERPAMTEGDLRRHDWPMHLSAPDPQLVEKLYVPALTEAERYDRCCAYFSSSVLSAAARGFAGLIDRLIQMGDRAPKPAIRLVVNEEMSAEDVRAMTEDRDYSRLEKLLLKRFKNPKDLLTKQRLAMLGWMVKEGYLDLRVGVMRVGGGIVHAKFGIITDGQGQRITFNGSGNESARALLSNYEFIDVFTSWDDPERCDGLSQEFEALWSDNHPDVMTVDLPEALRLKLIKLAAKEPTTIEPSTALARQKAAMVWHFIAASPYMIEGGGETCDATAMVDLWPHQRYVVRETAEAWPDGRLLCDEVGMGKTIEAICVLRRLMAGRGVKRALLLVPRGLLTQWQNELREKGGLIVPRLDGPNVLIWPNEKRQTVDGLREALQEDVLLMSRETARTENNLPWLLEAEPWDLVLMDEAHAARRATQVENEFNSATLLLNMLRELQLRRQARGILLLSATPMQTSPWEPWDLLAVLGEGDRWLSQFSYVRRFYDALQAVERGRCVSKMARFAAELICEDEAFPPPPEARGDEKTPGSIARAMMAASPRQRPAIARWMRRGSPLMRRMHRNTKGTLREYYARGMLEKPPAVREIHDLEFDYGVDAERSLYRAVNQYIDNRFAREDGRTGIGLVKTVYQRRAASSPLAIRRSLERRASGLFKVIRRRGGALLLEEDELSGIDFDDDYEDEGLTSEKISAALPTDPQMAQEERREVHDLLAKISALNDRDSKRDKLYDILREMKDERRSILIFTQYSDTVEYLRENLVVHYPGALGCYTGAGGFLWDSENERWKNVSKDRITALLTEGKLRILICNDAASEGLNLQAASALVNYDLPWNPGRVEQRIGRIDRIGQTFDTVKVFNLFLTDSVDERVYGALRRRCGLFEHFVGHMQPVLARARRMLQGREEINLNKIDEEAGHVDADPLAAAVYAESDARDVTTVEAPVDRETMQWALSILDGTFGLRVKKSKSGDSLRLSGLQSKAILLALSPNVLEHDARTVPISPLSGLVGEIAAKLSQPGERLPLVIGQHCEGSFRTMCMYWIEGEKARKIRSIAELRQILDSWNGKPPKAAVWAKQQRRANGAAERHVHNIVAAGDERRNQGLHRQLHAALIRLRLELGYYLVSLDSNTADLRSVLRSQLDRDIRGAARLRRCVEKVGGYPNWVQVERDEVGEFAAQISERERTSRIAGKEVDAALVDPRWAAKADGVAPGCR